MTHPNKVNIDKFVAHVMGCSVNDFDSWYDTSSFGNKIEFSELRFHRWSVQVEDQQQAHIAVYQLSRWLYQNHPDVIAGQQLIIQPWNQTTMWCHTQRAWVKCSQWKVQILVRCHYKVAL